MTYDKLADLAAKTIIKVMQEGEVKHPENDYMDRPLTEHAKHAALHAQNAWSGMVFGFTGYDLKDELEHALTRLAIVLAKMEGEE